MDENRPLNRIHCIAFALIIMWTTKNNHDLFSMHTVNLQKYNDNNNNRLFAILTISHYVLQIKSANWQEKKNENNKTI